MLIRNQRNVAAVLMLALLVAGCARRQVVNEAGEPLTGTRIDLALALNDVTAGMVDWADAVDLLAADGQITPERADSIRTANVQFARSARLLNDALRDSADDVTVLDRVRTVQASLTGIIELVPDGGAAQSVLGVLVEAVNIMLETALAIEVQP